MTNGLKLSEASEGEAWLADLFSPKRAITFRRCEDGEEKKYVEQSDGGK